MCSRADEVCLELVAIYKQFAGVHAVSNINLRVYKGERVAFIGPNGAGKTTLFNMINGEYYPTSGRIYMFGEDITRMPANKRVNRGMARTFQVTNLFQNESVLENVLLALMGTSRKDKLSLFTDLSKKKHLFEEADKLISNLGLSAYKNEFVRNLPYGDQRVVEIVLAMASKPRIICLDEPNAGLSNKESRMIIDLINNQIGRDVTVLIIEHDIDLIFEVADRIMVLSNGEEVAIGSKESIRSNPYVQKVYLGEEK